MRPPKTLLLSSLLAAGAAPLAAAQTLDPFYASEYTVDDLGQVPGVPVRLGGLNFKADDVNTLIFGGAANSPSGALYEIAVTRDAAGHVTGFSGMATQVATAAYIDGGVAYGPGNVLFLSAWPVNDLGQRKPGSPVTDKVIDLDPFGVAFSHSACNFVPASYRAAGRFKLVSYGGGQWYDVDLTPDGLGTFDVANVTPVLLSQLPGGPEGFVYVPLGSPLFPVESMLVSEYQANSVATYEVDANGDPIVATRRDFLTGLDRAEGAVIDPLTGDFLFSTFGGGDRVIVVKGFSSPPTLTVANLVAGGTAEVTVENATPDGSVGVAYSLAGSGPSILTAGSCGAVTVNLSAPIAVLGIFAADASGTLVHQQAVPASASGLAVWLHAIDLSSCTLTNSLAEVIG